MVSGTAMLFIGKTVRISAEVSCSAGHGLIVEVIVAVYVLNDVIPAYFHLATGIGRTVYIKVLK